MTYKRSKLGEDDLVFVFFNQRSSVDLCMQDYKSMVMICATQVNTQTDSFDRLYYELNQLS